LKPCPEKSSHASWRARVGDYRIVYDVVREQVIVLVLRIAHRREAYRSL
jgi:mRNA interferase RelE/StbE